MVLDKSGNLYGTTYFGGVSGRDGPGTVYELTPSGSGWTEEILYSFPFRSQGDGTTNPLGDVIFDQAGNLYGTGTLTEFGCCGAVFELTPPNWTYSAIHVFRDGISVPQLPRRLWPLLTGARVDKA